MKSQHFGVESTLGRTKGIYAREYFHKAGKKKKGTSQVKRQAFIQTVEH